MMRRTLVLALCLSGCTMTVHAQDRMPPIPESQQSEAQKKAIAEFNAARKTTGISGPFVPMLRSPEVMNRARAMGDYLRFNSVLPPRLSEFAILITARKWTQNYEWDAHSQLALQGGLAADIV
jgi:4-carboxymuconolactone decarboxylase